jgi:hypothetical protein
MAVWIAAVGNRIALLVKCLSVGMATLAIVPSAFIGFCATPVRSSRLDASPQYSPSDCSGTRRVMVITLNLRVRVFVV